MTMKRQNVTETINIRHINIQKAKNEEKTEGVTSWEACSELCQQRADCTHWKWNNGQGQHKQASRFAHQCVTMTGFEYANCYDNTVVGTRDCVPP